jgi:hypothetical protein
MKSHYPRMRQLERCERIRRTAGEGLIHFPGADAQTQGQKVDSIEFLGIGDERVIAMRDDLRDDRLNCMIDVLGGLPLYGEKRLERNIEIRASRLKPQGHEIVSFAVNFLVAAPLIRMFWLKPPKFMNLIGAKISEKDAGATF